MSQFLDIGLDNLHCSKQRKFPKLCRDLNLEQTMLNSSELFLYASVCSSFKMIDPLFYKLHTFCKAHRHADGHAYSIFEFDKQQL